MAFDPNNISGIASAIGALGTAAFGLVDTLKAPKNWGISNAGFAFITALTARLFRPERYLSEQRFDRFENVAQLNAVLHANWINGAALADQKAIAKSLIKLRLDSDNARALADATFIDSGAMAAEAVGVLQAIGNKMSTGEPLNAMELNVLGRFDLALTSMIDEAYQHADQQYRNSTKFAAMLIAIALAVVGGWSLMPTGQYFGTVTMWQAVLVGLLATPLAPISKDLATALGTAVKALQAVRGRK